MHLQQFLQLGNGIAKLGKKLIKRRVKVADFLLLPVVYSNAA